jgi:hypothetical protein
MAICGLIPGFRGAQKLSQWGKHSGRAAHPGYGLRAMAKKKGWPCSQPFHCRAVVRLTP